MKENCKMRGHVRYELRDEHGHIKDVQTSCNDITEEHDAVIATQALMGASGVSVIGFLDLGTGTGQATSDTTLATPHTGDGRIGVSKATASGGDDNDLVVSAYVPAGVYTASITEAGLFRGATTDNMMCYDDSISVVKGASDTLAVTWTITYGASLELMMYIFFIFLLAIFGLCIYKRKNIYGFFKSHKRIGVALVTGCILGAGVILNPLDDPPGDEEEPVAYDYWYAPENSFGISETKDINWSYFQSLFNNHFYKDGRYKRYSYSNWQDGSSYVGVDKTWNGTGFWKINITLDVPVDLYEVNISFGCDLPVLQYVEREGYEVWINYSANATETYSIMFNWSDLKDIPGLTVTKHHVDNIFWISLHRNNVPSGYYVFDPIFGSDVESTSMYNMEDVQQGIWGEAVDGDGTADSISVLMTSRDGYEGDVKCALYEYVDYSSVYAGEFIASTQEVHIDSDFGQEWVQFDFSEPKPSITDNTKYYIISWAEKNVGDDVLIHRLASTPGYSIYDLAVVYNGWEDPFTEDGASSYTRRLYCTYTITPPLETFTEEIRTNGTDYFVWAGGNITANDVAGNISSFDEAGEYIAKQNGTGEWWKYDFDDGDAHANDWDVYTYDVIKTYLTDSGEISISMTETNDLEYNVTREVNLENNANYSGYTVAGNTSLLNISHNNINPAVASNYVVGWWDETNFQWWFWIEGFEFNIDKDVFRWDVVYTFVDQSSLFTMEWT